MFVVVKKIPSARAGFALAVVALAVSSAIAEGPPKETPVVQNTASGSGSFWSEPSDWATRDLFYGPGGKAHEPRGPFRFEKEDLDGSNPKFVVRDPDGVKWKVKLGLEARPETVATRLAWAAGYYANEDYFLAKMRVEGMPAHLHRGQELIGPGGEVQNVRLKREDEKKIGIWQWDKVAFAGTREWNGLRALMALINNWDLKDVNNSVYSEGLQNVYMVSDLGASFGSASRTWPPGRAKDNLNSYRHARFIRRIGADTVDFQVPGRPSLIYLFNPKAYFMRVHLEHLGRNIPRADAKWLGQLLARLSPAQIHDAFRAAGYSPAEIEAFSSLLEERITALTDL
ncbi:MAG: hypothetical protein ABSG65_19855 [Bryobacteraceae bacterium]|jgi:hypothetical protein